MCEVYMRLVRRDSVEDGPAVRLRGSNLRSATVELRGEERALRRRPIDELAADDGLERPGAHSDLGSVSGDLVEKMNGLTARGAAPSGDREARAVVGDAERILEGADLFRIASASLVDLADDPASARVCIVERGPVDVLVVDRDFERRDDVLDEHVRATAAVHARASTAVMRAPCVVARRVRRVEAAGCVSAVDFDIRRGRLVGSIDRAVSSAAQEEQRAPIPELHLFCILSETNLARACADPCARLLHVGDRTNDERRGSAARLRAPLAIPTAHGGETRRVRRDLGKVYGESIG